MSDLNRCEEYCFNYGCTQAQNCPVRKENIERVAKVGKRMQDKSPIIGPVWKDLKGLAKWVLTGLLFWIVLTPALYWVIWR